MMSSLNTLTTLLLSINCIRVVAFLISYSGVKLLGAESADKLINCIYYADTIIHIATFLFIAYALSIIKEVIWRSVAFVTSAFMSTVFLILILSKTTDTKLYSAIGVVNTLVIIFFLVQSFLIKAQYFKNTFRVFSVVMILMVAFNRAIPYIAATMAIPALSLLFTPMLGIIPATIECYIIYLFQQYFNSAGHNLNNDFSSNL